MRSNKTILQLSIFIVLTVMGNLLYGQHQMDNWYFGLNAAVNFSSGNPVSVSNGQTTAQEGVATISDGNGNLLFYTDGITVWNRNNVVMTNGMGLSGGYSSTQVLIVPQPGNDSIYYIFTVAHEGNPQGLCYSIVDMAQQSGLGAVIQKNIPVLTPVCEKLAATIHSNNMDIWIVAHRLYSTDYYSWLLTSSGLATTPTISHTANAIGFGVHGAGEAIGYLTFSPDGTKIAAAHQQASFIELGDFNNNTGSITNILNISAYFPIPGPLPVEKACYGIAFSPNIQLLYTTTWRYFDLPPYPQFVAINQYDISSNDVSTIEQSHYYVDSFRTINSELRSAIQIGPDNKLYIATLYAHHLSAINNPDIQGPGAGFVNNAVSLNIGECAFGLPTFIQHYYNVLQAPGFTFNSVAPATVGCGVQSSGISLTTTSTGSFTTPINLTATGNPVGTFVNFSTNPVVPGSGTAVTLSNISMLASGSYSITITGTVGAIVQTAILTYTILPGTAPTITTQPLPVAVCAGSDVIFRVAAAGTGIYYQWQVSTTGCAGSFIDITGATAAEYTFTGATAGQSGYTYRVVITSNCSVTSVTSSCADLIVNPIADVSLTVTPNLTTLLPGETVLLTASVVPAGNYIFTWRKDGAVLSNTGNSLTVSYNDIGTYTVSAGITGGCSDNSNAIEINDSVIRHTYMYPNPSDGQFSIVYYDPNNPFVHAVGVFDSKGSRVFLKNFTNTQPNAPIYIDLRMLSSAVYIVILYDGSGHVMYTGKIIVMHKI